MATKKVTEQSTNEQTKINFEQGLSRLDEIITILERDNVPLDELMKLYEEGVGLLRTCNEQLERAEQTVQVLSVSPDATKLYLQDFSKMGESVRVQSERADEKENNL